MIRTFGCKRSFSNHIERKKSKCDYHFDRALTENEIAKLNKKVNVVINMSLDIEEEVLSFEEANKNFDLGKISNQTSTSIGIIKVGDYDW